jgi:hypothetical protein
MLHNNKKLPSCFRNWNLPVCGSWYSKFAGRIAEVGIRFHEIWFIG